MTNRYEKLKNELLESPKTWCITGAAGFIGSNLLESLLKLNQKVVGIDNFNTGYQKNLDEVQKIVSPEQWQRFEFINGDIRDLDPCLKATDGADYVLHQAALVSVPLSMEDPVQTHDINVNGFHNILHACHQNKVGRLVYASSSAVYGDDTLPAKVEETIGNALSPYATSKYLNEIYAKHYGSYFKLPSVGLRYFNVFGPRQDPGGAYAAVISKWLSSMIKNEPIVIFGTGEATRDYCHVGNVVQANLLAATIKNTDELDQVFNVGLGLKTNLNELFQIIKSALAKKHPHVQNIEPEYKDSRPGDILHSTANVESISKALSYESAISLQQGIEATLSYYENVD
jgi:UDP-N-acetylglucosamine/UDP-N-acetylgalactosamine 4-epimerase